MNISNTLICVLLAAALAVSCSQAGRSHAEEPVASPAQPDSENPWAFWMRELQEGRDALEWSDQRVDHDWRLQAHSDGMRWRLLNDADQVVVQGGRADCETTYERLQAAGTIPTVRGPTVIVLHGLGQSRHSMQPLVSHLRTTLDATVLSVGYASPQAGLEAHAETLDHVIAALPQATTLSFVGHSLGNLVVRRWMSTAPAATLARVQRMVMLGPPNQGSELARLASRVWFLAMLSDGPTRQLGLDWDQVGSQLAIPPCDFGIVAGGTGDSRGMSMLLTGDDDAIVTVEETRLEGASDFLLLPVHHADMMRSKAVQQAALCFLQEGHFPPAPPTAPPPALPAPAVQSQPLDRGRP